MKVCNHIKYTHKQLWIVISLLSDERDLPPLRSADAPTYWKLSMLMTSMMGDTTRVLSCREEEMM